MKIDPKLIARAISTEIARLNREIKLRSEQYGANSEVVKQLSQDRTELYTAHADYSNQPTPLEQHIKDKK